MSKEYKTAQEIFTNTLSEMMTEHGITYETCTKKDVDITIAICTSEFNETWDDLMEYMLYKNDAKSRTLDFIRIGLQHGNLYNGVV